MKSCSGIMQRWRSNQTQPLTCTNHSKTVMTIIMLRVTTINCVALLICLSISLSFIHGERDVIDCTVIDGETNIHLRLKKTEQLLVNENLPVWTAKRRAGRQTTGSIIHKLIPNLVKDGIGDFILYQDKEKSAAFVLFMRTQTLTGVIDTRYAITALPLHHCHHGAHLGGGYVEILNCKSMNHRDHLKTLDHAMQGEIDVPIHRDDPDRFMQEDWVTTLYLEVMVFNLYDLTKLAKEASPENYLPIIVAQYIIYFNAADMLISKLSTNNIKIHLNLAGIVIEDGPNVFSWFKPDGENDRFIHTEKEFSSFIKYGSEHHTTFPQDSFDIFYISTGNEMWSSFSSRRVDGTSRQSNVYVKRTQPTTIRYWSGVAVRFMCGYEYITAAHEIAHIMGVEHDPLNKGYCSAYTQCYGVMQEYNKYCPDCIKWSEESVEDLKRYVKQDRDRCYFLNVPRSLFPHGSLMMTLTPLDQCRCYGFQSGISIYETLNVIPRGGCSRSLICDHLSPGSSIPAPVDGTPCNTGVCWNNICQ